MDGFAENSRKRAQQLGLSHAEVARKSGLSERRYGNYVSGIRQPDFATLLRISAALLTTPNDLLSAPSLSEGDDVSEARREAIRLLQLLPDEQVELINAQLEGLIRRLQSGEAEGR
jgi:transcriptional regulator with XRE-family HTH domain